MAKNTVNSDKIMEANQPAALDAAKMFGADMDQVGWMNKNVINERQAALNEQDPISSMIKNSANTQTRAASATKRSQGGGNLSVGERSQIKRSAEADSNQQLFGNKKKNLDKYSQMANSIASNTLGLKYGQDALNVKMPGGITIICSELHRQGYLSDEVIALDQNFGVELRKNSPEVYEGYIVLASPVVKLMQKSKLVTKLVSFFGVAWANNMAYSNNKFGKLIHIIGMPIDRKSVV